MRRVLMISAVLGVFSTPAFAMDYVKDVLLGNTVEMTNNINGESARFHFKDDNSVTMLRPGKPNEDGSWRDAGAQLCTTFPSVGQEVCRQKPANATVPGEAAFKGKTPAGQDYDFVVKWLAGQVAY
jgi:hypothetical protein